MIRNKLLFFLVMFFSCSLVSAKTYTIEQVMSDEEINNSTLGDYIIVNSDYDGDYYALSSTLLEGENPKKAQAKENAELVTFNEDFTKLIVESENNILWTFGLSANSVAQGMDRVTLVSRKNVFTGVDSSRTQLAFSNYNSTTNPAGLAYTNDAYPLDFEVLDEGNFIISSRNTKNAKTYYLCFSSSDKRFRSSDNEDSASEEIKIYKVKHETEKIDGFVTSEKGVLDFNKTKEQEDKFKENGVYKVDLSLSSSPLMKDSDVIFVLDISNSMDFEDKIDQLKNNANSLAESILKMNSNNRVGIVKFADGNLLVEESNDLGLSSDINKIKELINADVADKLGGTNYTEAFELANDILSQNRKKGRDQVVIFITDGAPTIYNKIKFSAFKNTNDGVVGEYAENWSNYILNNKLGIVETMKESGIKIFTVGVNINEDMALKSDGSFVIKPEVAAELLKNMASTDEYFFKVEDYEHLGEAFNRINNIFKINLSDVIVNDSVVKKYKLTVEPYGNKNPYIEIKKENGNVIEKITFNKEGTEAYSSLNEGVNVIKNNADGKILKTDYFTYNFDTKAIVWNVEEVTKEKIILTYFIKPEKEQTTYKDDYNAISNIIKISYIDFDGKREQITIENPNTSANTLIGILALVSLLVFISLLFTKYKMMSLR